MFPPLSSPVLGVVDEADRFVVLPLGPDDPGNDLLSVPVS